MQCYINRAQKVYKALVVSPLNTQYAASAAVSTLKLRVSVSGSSGVRLCTRLFISAQFNPTACSFVMLMLASWCLSLTKFTIIPANSFTQIIDNTELVASRKRHILPGQGQSHHKLPQLWPNSRIMLTPITPLPMEKIRNQANHSLVLALEL